MSLKNQKIGECLGCKSSFKYGKNCFGKYCSNKCQQQHYRVRRIEEWRNNQISPIKAGGRLCSWAREYLLEQASYQCTQCGWKEINKTTGKSPLEIDHIDGNASNCQHDNLRVLCPNCHSLTPTYKALNKGNGFKDRLRYSKLSQ